MAASHFPGADKSPLGQSTAYPERYAPEQLFAISREKGRAGFAFAEGLPFYGTDLWNAYEISWLDPNGRPQICAATLRIPCESPAMVESKSLKLYLNSLNQHRFANEAAVQTTIETDLTKTTGAPVTLQFYTSNELAALGFANATPANARCLDDRPLKIEHYERAPQLLAVKSGTLEPVQNEVLYTNLFKSNCPVTAQPDWASVFIKYSGARLDEDALLTYLLSYRLEQEFHEHCVEQIFMDLQQQCAPEQLTVYACFLRRGGLDINPFRSNFEEAPAFLRTARQ